MNDGHGSIQPCWVLLLTHITESVALGVSRPSSVVGFGVTRGGRLFSSEDRRTPPPRPLDYCDAPSALVCPAPCLSSVCPLHFDLPPSPKIPLFLLPLWEAARQCFVGSHSAC
jgi:hypothetical protein